MTPEKRREMYGLLTTARDAIRQVNKAWPREDQEFARAYQLRNLEGGIAEEHYRIERELDKDSDDAS